LKNAIQMFQGINDMKILCPATNFGEFEGTRPNIKFENWKIVQNAKYHLWMLRI